METLHNLHPIEIGVGETGTTIRNGRKWLDIINSGESFVELCVCTPEGEHTVVGKGQLTSAVLKSFNELLAVELADEHELSSRNYSGLLESMRRAYGEQFSESSPVTVLHYKRIE